MDLLQGATLLNPLSKSKARPSHYTPRCNTGPGLQQTLNKC